MNLQRIGLRILFWTIVIANLSTMLPMSAGSPGPMNSIFLWNASHLQNLFSPYIGWLGSPIGGWWMFTHKPGTEHVYSNWTIEIEVRDAKGKVHLYDLYSSNEQNFLLNLTRFRDINFQYFFPSLPKDNPQLLRNVVLWHVRRNLSLHPDETPPFAAKCYQIFSVINPPGSVPEISPPRTIVLSSLEITPNDLACVSPHND